MNSKAELFTVGVRAAAVTAGTAVGGFAGRQIGGVAGSVIPIVGTYAGRAAGTYVGAAVGGCVGDAAGDAFAGFILPLVEEVTSQSYIHVTVRDGHKPPEFFERIMRY